MNKSDSPKLYQRVKSKWPAMIATVSLVSIALGQFNDTMDAVERIYNFGYSTLTDQPSRNKLAALYINASEHVLENEFGAPVYLKHTYNGKQIRYYQDRRFLLSAMVDEGAVVALLVFPIGDFKPDTFEHAGGEDYLYQSFSQVEEVNSSRALLSRAASYYIEENSGGRFSLLYHSIGGYSEFLSPMNEQQKQVLSTLTQMQILGQEELVPKALQQLRQVLVPNFYGYSTLPLDELEEAILTNTEYQLIHQK